MPNPNVLEKLLNENPEQQLIQLKTQHLKELNALMEENTQKIKALNEENQRLNSNATEAQGQEQRLFVDANKKTGTETAASNLSTAVGSSTAYASGSSGSSGSLSLILKQIETVTGQLQEQIRVMSTLKNTIVKNTNALLSQQQNKYVGESTTHSSMRYNSSLYMLNSHLPPFRLPERFLDENNGFNVLTTNWDIYAKESPAESFEWMEYEANMLAASTTTATTAVNNTTGIRAISLKEQMALSVVEEINKPKRSSLELLKLAILAYARSQSPHIPKNTLELALVSISKKLLSLHNVVKEMSGWCHVARYIDNPQQYTKNMRAAEAGNKVYMDAWHGDYPWFSRLKNIENFGYSLMNHYYQLLETALDHQAESFGTINPLYSLDFLSNQKSWIEAIDRFMKMGESAVTELLTKNQQKFQSFRELQRKEVSWPHSYTAFLQMEESGFVYRPMMIKRDRCVCETCGVEISSLYDWFDIRSFHNFAKHPPSFAAQWGVSPPPGATVIGYIHPYHPYYTVEVVREITGAIRQISLISYVDQQSLATLRFVEFLSNLRFDILIHPVELIRLIVSYAVPFNKESSSQLFKFDNVNSFSKLLHDFPRNLIHLIISYIGTYDLFPPNQELVTIERKTILNQFKRFAVAHEPEAIETATVASNLLDNLTASNTTDSGAPNAPTAPAILTDYSRTIRPRLRPNLKPVLYESVRIAR